MQAGACVSTRPPRNTKHNSPSNADPFNVITRITAVIAHWCPHCNPPALDAVQRMGEELGIPTRILDIDRPDQEKLADDLVRKYGDWAEDYIIPQIYVEYADGTAQHLFTGYSEGVPVTQAKLQNIYRSPWYQTLLQEQRARPPAP